MGLTETLLLAAALAMDAFAAAVCKGMSMRKTGVKAMLTVGLWFGGFQALMPLIGFALGTAFEKKIEAVDHWAAFALLCVIGINMIREAFGSQDAQDGCVDIKSMAPAAVAVSIDALAAGVTFILDGVNVPVAVTVTGVITFLLSAAGVKAGSLFGMRYKKRAELAGGVTLIGLGIKIVLEHTGIIDF